jgi:hypothetical protein
VTVAAVVAVRAFPVVFWFSVGNVQLARFPEVGVPSTGVVKEGDVANTAAPEPVSSVSAAASWADVNDPRTAAFPTEVTWPVRFALVVTVPAVNPEAVPVQFVSTPDAGVPSAGAVSVLLDSVSVPASVARVPATTGSVSEILAPATSVVLNAPVVAKFPASANVPTVLVSAVPPALTTTAVFAVRAGRSANPAVMASSSERAGADCPAEPAAGHAP